MKNIKSLQVLGLAGVAIALTTGCSSTQMGANHDTSAERAAYRFAGGTSFQPITDINQMGRFPIEWNPATAGESYVYEVPVANSANVASSATLPTYSDGLQPGDAFVEAAGASNDGKGVRRVILYTPFSGH